MTNSFFYAILSGFWMGVMSEESLDWADEIYFTSNKDYVNAGFNLLGLFRWEEVMIKRHFSNVESILLIAAGGGREILALKKMGYKVDSYECNLALLEFGNSLLRKNGITDRIKYLPRNEAPDEIKKYDGIIIGWAAYTHIRGNKRRVMLLRKLAPFLSSKEAPLMLSFLIREKTSRQERLTKFISNFFRLFTHKEKTELGDRLIPLFAHYFTEAEIKSELSCAKLTVTDYSCIDYGCVIATL